MNTSIPHVIPRLTGHMHSGSPYETDSDCGNCDGAKCDFCSTIFCAYHAEEEYTDEAEAEKQDAEFLTLFEGVELGPNDLAHASYIEVKNGNLVLKGSTWDDEKEEHVDTFIQLNKQSPRYKRVIA